jgi:hypothetical protein
VLSASDYFLVYLSGFGRECNTLLTSAPLIDGMYAEYVEMLDGIPEEANWLDLGEGGTIILSIHAETVWTAFIC